MKQYLDLMQYVLDNGVDRGDRTGTGTRSIFGYQMRFDLAKGFPLLTTKKIHTKSIIHELLWFLAGKSNIKYLQDHRVKIWNEWADSEGEVGPIYGVQWRIWAAAGGGSIDQIAQVIESIKSNPNSRRLVVSAWNVAKLGEMTLPPCHVMFQFYVAEGKLSCQMYQRSADIFLGLPFNIASYGLLCSMVAQVTGLVPGDLIVVLGDTHLYNNHFEQAELQLSREPKEPAVLVLNTSITDISDFTYDDIIIEYVAPPHPHIAAKVSV